MWWQLILAGLLVGALVGMTGMGGGSLMTPILVILFGVSPAVAVGSDIAHGAIFKTVGALQHRKMGNVRAQLAGWMLLGSAPTSLLGVFPLRAHKVVGTDIFHAAALLYVAGAGHWVAGNVDMGIVGWLLLGSVPGVLVGGRLSVSIPERLLRFALATVLGLSGLKL